jgi:hypothetical protein
LWYSPEAELLVTRGEVVYMANYVWGQVLVNGPQDGKISNILAFSIVICIVEWNNKWRGDVKI